MLFSLLSIVAGAAAWGSLGSSARVDRSLGSRTEDALDLLAQPAICGVIRHALMPVHLGLELSCLHGKGIDTVAESSVQDLRVTLGQGQQKIGFADHSAGGEIMLAAQSDPSAEAEPAALFVGKDGGEALEFERTASSLIEMRSADYLAHAHGGPGSGSSGDMGGLVET